jgi:tRNA threonylcarbamoyl adenosine modification protein (Sua5/YciO/YrdC/YwlC family)
MSQTLYIHPDNPQARLIHQAVEIINRGGIVVYPTDSCYAIGCHIDNKAARDRIRHIRRLSDKHHFTLMCRDLSEISKYGIVDNMDYRLLKSLTPGAYTFILQATREVPRRLQNPKRKTIGLRIPEHNIAQALLTEMDEPLMSSTLIMPNDDLPLNDPYQIQLALDKHVELIIDGGFCGYEPTTVIDLMSSTPIILRQGKGEVNWLIQH